mmetsp:Transcript_1666/g.2221  ORF Transcript_1666/g.2221 Transcript_1666/m.2221 type:complete len:345 (-) Transcript_1666:228-1262(-)
MVNTDRYKHTHTRHTHTQTMHSKKTKKNKYATLPVTPKGVQSGPIEHEYVPVTDYKKTPKEQGLRRSNRSKIKPLAFWKNERPVFGANSATGYLKEAMGAMPVVMGYEKAMPTPYKKRKIAHRNNHDGAGMNKKKKGYNNNNNSSNNIQYQDEPVIVEQKPFDARKLKKKFDFHTGQEATMWDESLEEPSEMKVVAFASKAKSSELPLPRSRKKHEGKVVGTASQSFNVPSGDNDVSIGYIMGNLCLPPNAIKDPESTGACSQVFTVCSCQPKSLEVAFGDPAEEDGNFVPETAQRFLLSAGDQFRIPPGNAYRLHNHSKTTDSQLAWTIIRPKYSNEENSSAA